MAGFFGGKLTHGVEYYVDACDKLFAATHAKPDDWSGATSTAIAAVNLPSKQRMVMAAAGTDQIRYIEDIPPIFMAHCVNCHGTKKQKGGYRIDLIQHAFLPGESTETPIITGNSHESPLVKMVVGTGDYADKMMPPRGQLLTPEQIVLIRTWIDQGAPWPDEVHMESGTNGFAGATDGAGFDRNTFD